MPALADEHEAETDVQELPAIGENEELRITEDQEDLEWLLPEEDAESSAASLPDQKHGQLPFWSLVSIMYFASSGGPDGTEGLVSDAGPGGALLGILVAACVWSAPIALMSAELGTMVPENGGPMVWARAAFGAGTLQGDGVAFLVGWCSFLMTAVDGALYPSLFVSYVLSGAGLILAPAQILAVKITFCLALILHNCAGVQAVGESSKVLMFLLMCPFIAFIVAAFTGIGGWPFDATTWAQVPAQPKYGDTIILLAWNLGMSLAALRAHIISRKLWAR
jgi:amino acid transporter